MAETQFLGVPDVTGWLFAGLVLTALATSYIGVVTGTAGGLVLLSVLAMVFPPAILVPMHTVVQLGTGSSRAVIMWRYIMRGTLLPFFIGCVLGAALGAQIFVALPTAVLQGAMGIFILILAWMPKFTRTGGEAQRFAALGFGTTFLGMFVSATGSLLAPFVAGASPDRRNYAATVATLMATGHITKLIAFGLLGVSLVAYAPLIAAMIAAAALGSWFGSRTLNRMPEESFRMVFKILLTCLALRLVWLGVSKMDLFG